MGTYKRKIAGVYLLLDEYRDIVYVGQSWDIYKRLVGHGNKDWEYFQYEEIKNIDERAQRESDLIKKYTPKYNLIYTKIIYPEYSNRTHRHIRWEMLRELKKKHTDFDSLSCRQIKYLLYLEHGIIVSHMTINRDLHNWENVTKNKNTVL